jgi:hypothetical protein
MRCRPSRGVGRSIEDTERRRRNFRPLLRTRRAVNAPKPLRGAPFRARGLTASSAAGAQSSGPSEAKRNRRSCLRTTVGYVPGLYIKPGHDGGRESVFSALGIRGQSSWLVNYAKRYRAGLRIGKSVTEATASFLVNRRRKNRSRRAGRDEVPISWFRFVARLTMERSAQGWGPISAACLPKRAVSQRGMVSAFSGHSARQRPCRKGLERCLVPRTIYESARDFARP